MASTGKSKLIASPKQRTSLQRRRYRKRHRKYTESVDTSESIDTSESVDTSESSSFTGDHIFPAEKAESSKLPGPSGSSVPRYDIPDVFTSSGEPMTSEDSKTTSEDSKTLDDSQPSEGAVPSEERLWPRKRKKSPSVPEHPKLASTPQWPAIPEPEEERKHSPERPTTKLRYYRNTKCKCCRELDKLKVEHQTDDPKYVLRNDDFEGDEELRLRVIHHRRQRLLTGNFDVGCNPIYWGGVYHRDHFGRQLPNFDRMIGSCARSTIAKYREKTKKELVFLRFLNATADIVGRSIMFFLTFECYNPLAEYYVDICQAMVSFYLTHVDMEDREIHVFRRVTNDDEDEDLLSPDRRNSMLAKVRGARRLDTWRDVQHQKGLF